MDHPFNFEAEHPELEKFLLLGLFVAGKNASIQQRKLDGFCESIASAFPEGGPGPLTRLRHVYREYGEAEFRRHTLQHLSHHRVGQYTMLLRALTWLCSERDLDLRSISREALAECPKISFKTASFFILYTRRDAQVACLDTHLLRYMREMNVADDVPAATPPPERYLELEVKFLELCRELNRNPAELDFEIWSCYRRRHDESPAKPAQNRDQKVAKAKKYRSKASSHGLAPGACVA